MRNHGKDGSKPSHSKSKRKARKNRKELTHDETAEENRLVLPEPEERRHHLQRNNHRRRSSSKRGSRSSSRSSPKKNQKVSSSGHERRNTRQHGRRRSRSRSSRTSRTASDLFESSRSLSARVDDDEIAKPSTSEDVSIPDLVTIDSRLCTSGSTTGANRVDNNMCSSSFASSTLHRRRCDNETPADGEESDINTQSITSRTPSTMSRTRSFRSTLQSALGEPSSEETAVDAVVVAQDYEDQLEEARQRGRREGIRELSQHRSATELAVAVAIEEDEDRHHANDMMQSLTKNKAFLYAVLLCLLFIAIGLAAATIFIFVGQQNTPNLLGNETSNAQESNAKVVVVYTPPTQQECEAIANSTILDDQLSLIQKSFDIQIDITLASEADLVSLFTAMLGYIQQKLVPLMAGCGEIRFFDTLIAIADGLKNATNAIANGHVEKKSEELCSATNITSSGPSGVCRSYVLVLDLYLAEEKSSASLIEVIGNALNGDDIQTALGALYPVQTASVAWIVPSEETTVDRIPIILPTPAPTVHPHLVAKPSIVAPTHTPTTGRPLMPALSTKTQRPTRKETLVPTIFVVPNPPFAATTNAPSKIVLDTTTNPDSSSMLEGPILPTAPTLSPTEQQTPQPSKVLTKAPTRNPTLGPTTAPNVLPSTVAPTTTRTPPPVNDPTKVPSYSPSNAVPASTASPTLAPTIIVPSEAPSEVASSSPSQTPTTTSVAISAGPSATTSVPSMAPSPGPSIAPSRVPTPVPSETPSWNPSPLPSVAPTDVPPTPFPTVAATPAPTIISSPAPSSSSTSFCCSNNYKDCDLESPFCQSDQYSCEVNCYATWIQTNSCSTGLARWSACNPSNDVTPDGCCPPAVCTSQGPGYSQCI